MSRTSKTLLRLGVPSLAAATMLAGVPAFFGPATAQTAQDPVTRVTLAPDNQDAPSGNCVTYTATVFTGTAGTTAATGSRTVTVRLTEGGAQATTNAAGVVTPSQGSETAGTNSAQFCDPETGAVQAFTTGTSRTFATSTTGGQQVATFGVLDRFNTAGTTETNTTTITAFSDANSNGVRDGSEPFDQSVQEVTPAQGANDVRGVDARPEDDTNVVGEAHRISVTLFNTGSGLDDGSNGTAATPQNVVSGVTPFFVVDGSNDANDRAAAACDGPTNSLGQTTCTYTGSAVSNDVITVFVNQTQAGVATSNNPDAGEPRDVVRKSYIAAQTGRTLDLVCLDETDASGGGTAAAPTGNGVGDENEGIGTAERTSAEDCANLTSNRDRTFRALIDNASTTSTTDTAGTLVEFTVSGGSGDETAIVAAPAAGQRTVGGSANQCTTVSNTGTTTNTRDSFCDVVINDPTPVSGQVLTVTGTIRGTSISDSGTLSFFDAPGEARNITVTADRATAVPGSVISFTATVLNGLGQPVPGVTVTFSENGAGAFRTTSTPVTGRDGKATVELQAAANESGAASVTGTLSAAQTECEEAANTTTGERAGNCTSTATAAFAEPTATTTPPTTTAPTATVTASPTQTVVATQTVTASPTQTVTPTGTGTPTPTGTPTGPVRTTCTNPVGIQLNRSFIVPGIPVRVTVTAPEGAEVQLQAYSRPSTDYRVARQTVVGDSGVVTFDVVPGTNTRLFANCVAQTNSASSSQVINVRTALSLTVVRNGRRDYTFQGRILPRRAGQLITLYRITNSGQRVLTSQIKTDNTGTYYINRKFTGSGTFGFLTRTGQTLTNAAGESNTPNTVEGINDGRGRPRPTAIF